MQITKRGDFVIVKYDQKFFPGEILANYDESAEVKVMASSGPKFWKWPDRDDILMYQWKDVLKKIDPPVIVSNRGTYEVKDLEFCN